MAVVSRVTTLALNNGTGTRTWQSTAATQDTAAGSSVVITTTIASSGLTPPGQADTVTMSLRVDGGSTVVRSYSLTPGSASQNSTFHFTADGQVASAARAGTLRIRLDVDKSTGALTDRYTANSDNTTGQSLPALWSVSQRDQGWVRSTTTYTSTMSNISLGGGKTEPAQFPEDLYARVTLGATAFQSWPVTLSLTNGAQTPRSSSVSATATFDRTWSGTSTSTGRVNRGFPALSSSFTLEASPGNATLTGQSWTTFTGSTTDTLQVDPRLTAVHLLQLDDNLYGTPPLSKQESSGDRPSTSIGYLSTAIHAARGSATDTTVTGGVNGVTVTLNLQAASGAGTAITGTVATQAEGGEDGWQDEFLIWTSSLPGGAWNKTVTVDGPADISGVSTYLRNSSAQYQLLAARSPFIEVIAGGGMSGEQGDHFTAGSGLLVGASLYNSKTSEIVAPDASPVPVASFVRFNPTTGLGEYLDSDLTWKVSTDGVPIPSFTMTQSPTDSRVYTKSFTPSETSGWGDVDFFAIPLLYTLAVAYSTKFQVSVVGSANTHSGFGLDALDLALNGTLSLK